MNKLFGDRASGEHPGPPRTASDAAARLVQQSVAFRTRRARARVAFGVAEHVVVVGCGPVAARFVDDILPWVVNGRLRVTVIGAEPQPAYNRVLIGEHAVGRVSQEALALADLANWRAAGVEVLLGTDVVSVDRSRRTIRCRRPVPDRHPRRVGARESPECERAPGGRTHTDRHGPSTSEPGSEELGASGAMEMTWDRLVFATGARPVRPNIRGIDPSPDGAVLPPGVIAMRDLEDAAHMRTVIQDKGHVVVLGGGVLGVEAALAAAETTGRATLVHTGDLPMQRVLSPGTAQLLRRRLSVGGVRCVSARAAAVTFDDDGRFAALEVTNDAPVAGDLLVLSCGVQARIDVAQRAGLETRNGIVVDHELQADVEGRVFAVGDCAEVLCRDPGCEPCVRRKDGSWQRLPTGMIAPGWRQAEYLAARIGAEITRLDDPRGTAVPVEPMATHEPSLLRLKARDMDLVVLESGVVPTQPAARRILFTDDALHQDLQIELEADGRLRRAVVLGRPQVVAHLSAVLESEQPLRGDLTYLLSLDSDWAAPEPVASGPEAVVCRCAGVSRGCLEAAMDNGADTAEKLRSVTRACTGCGTCGPEIQALLADRTEHV